MSDHTITLDVREDIRAGREPFSKIMDAVGRLQASDDLLVIAPFEPEPLYYVLAKRGFRPDAQQLATGDWQIIFSRAPEKVAELDNAAPATVGEIAGAKAELHRRTSAEVLTLDVRGLEPPQPLVSILEALETWPDGLTLHAHTDRRPMHLYAQLEERGFTGESQEQSDGSFITHIRRR